MKILKPLYYDQFRCIANECEDTCCKGWTVHVDKKTFNRYRKIAGDYGKYVNRHIKRIRTSDNDLNYAKVDLVDQACPFLNEDQLCELYANLDESYLCNTCKMYPRDISRYNDRCERGMTVSCPEVARILVQNKERLSFCITDEKISELDKAYLQEGGYDQKLEQVLWDTRMLLIEITQFRELPLWKRLFFIKLSGDEIQKIIHNKKYNELESVVLNIKGKVQDEDYINEIDHLTTLPKVKVALINGILEARCTEGSINSTFMKFIEEIENVNQKYIGNLEEYLKTEEEFNEYFSDKEYMLENYMVNNIYNNIMKAVYDRNLTYKITQIIVSYAIVRKMLFARWIDKDKQIQEKDVIDAIYSFSRNIEHYAKFIDVLCQ